MDSRVRGDIVSGIRSSDCGRGIGNGRDKVVGVGEEKVGKKANSVMYYRLMKIKML